MTHCPHCSREIERGFRFCPWCGAAQRLKLTAFFPASETNEHDQGKALRVSRYLAEENKHVRVSVWNEQGKVEGAISIDDEQARRLVGFLLQGEQRPSWKQPLRDLIDELRSRTGNESHRQPD